MGLRADSSSVASGPRHTVTTALHAFASPACRRSESLRRRALHKSSRRPRARMDDEGSRWKASTTAVPQKILFFGCQPHDMLSGGSDAEHERRPPVLKAGVLARDPQLCLIDIVQARQGEDIAELPFPGSRLLR